jgi:hypothetical protein
VYVSTYPTLLNMINEKPVDMIYSGREVALKILGRNDNVRAIDPGA